MQEQKAATQDSLPTRAVFASLSADVGGASEPMLPVNKAALLLGLGFSYGDYER